MVSHSVCDIFHVGEHDNPTYWAEAVPTLSHKIAILAPPMLHVGRVGIAVDKASFFPSSLEKAS
ncbi:hypothetical protein L873DRAFT_1818732 [Choiromyces venosus 120613-1]|uniref:Uncharacterized protein n=1 Tax=Choiromyces venosus 120613-1 TaxID=1336337 RepID=A0A3N4J0Z8_9PEZI|nr:hypothetical protein L873DRAFT_1818732 [Choiromyces venosus 120613-1]